ncbi:putative domain HDIG-containing protein [Desulfosporosinus acidiphilus SJ4]|uniref:Putative domain HDIG-containing protein n=1 Tax=Desulfosporosinus acidiphilus (strain DSM 22704 / JCM 16185 / SJ4) TaxID=646529 RepID=I4DCA5_DESAJ|nr:HDOD domain-containing protein [Desulfosporosinus acidiphilus]AFM43429.1 putative domain HDIG-containing protein [Desulfosporosinus acidiphilus SJ4]
MPVKLEHILTRVNTLPPLPTAAVKVVTLTKDPTTTVKELETVISQDPALAAGMLKQANSAYYGYARRISSLQEAIVMLGFQATQGLAMASAVAPILKTPLIGYEIEQEGLWKHSMLTAMAAKRLCQHLRLPFGEVAFTAGLLHDIGKLVISIYIQEVNTILLQKVQETSLSYVELEEKVIGYDHATVGGYLAINWNLPDDLVEGISYHHSPLKAHNFIDLASVIHIANGLANLLGTGGGVDSFFNPLEQEILDRFTLKESDLERLISEIGEYLVDPSIFG